MKKAFKYVWRALDNPDNKRQHLPALYRLVLNFQAMRGARPYDTALLAAKYSKLRYTLETKLPF